MKKSYLLLHIAVLFIGFSPYAGLFFVVLSVVLQTIISVGKSR